MAVVTLRVISIRIFARIEQQSDDIDIPVLSGQGEGAMALLGASLAAT
jgi:hypothetical protein